MVQAKELIRLLYGEEAEGKVNPDERLRRWAEAFDDWLEYRGTRFSRKIGAASHKAWAEFLAITRKAPWEVEVEDVEAFIEALRGKGLRASTILGRLAGINRFYEYCLEEGIDPQCEERFNPVAKVCRPKVKGYAKANYLSLVEEKALLEVIRNDPSVMGKRDYALISLLLRTGCRAGDARGLRWGYVAPQVHQGPFDLAQGKSGAGSSSLHCIRDSTTGFIPGF
jgi:integrase